MQKDGPVLDIVVATMRPFDEAYSICNKWLEKCAFNHRLRLFINKGHGPVRAYQEALEQIPEAKFFGFIHDDVAIYEPEWDTRVLELLKSPRIGVVGFGGGWGHGSGEIYKTPYHLAQLQRYGYASNVNDAEVHGRRFTGDREVAVLDGYALFAKRELLEQAGGWPVKDLVFHCYDYWLCCMAHRLGYQVWMTGVKCHHFGGMTSTKDGYNNWLKENLGKTDVDIHVESHAYIYNEFSDVLPWEVPH
jgi:hypothetical protein